MTHVTSMLETYPKSLGGIDRQKLDSAIWDCFQCAQTCTACADACLAEDTAADLAKCIRLNLDCSDICATTGRVLSRHTAWDVGLATAMLEACRVACATCAVECEAHADHMGHCRVCAEACRNCEQACADLLTALR